jgi:protein ImuA
MKHSALKSDIAQRLQKEIFSLEGFKTPSGGQHKPFGLGEMEEAFPNGIFPMGAVHELVSTGQESAAATTGFIAALLGKVMQQRGSCLWISTHRTVFPSALKFFGVEPDRVIFVDLKKENDLLWAIEESLKCNALAAVVGEIKEITLTESRRLQLAVEQSQVTGFLHRYNPRQANNLACVSRWEITPVPSQLEPGMPGVGYPRWRVQLVRVRNGEPGEWELEWSDGAFQHVRKVVPVVAEKNLLQAG